MFPPKTREADYNRFQEEYELVVNRFVRGEISKAKSGKLIEQIWNKYNGKVFREDFHYFDTEPEFRSALRSFLLHPDALEEIVSHEREHFDEAKRQGYTPKYGLTVYLKDRALPWMPFWFSAYVTCKSNDRAAIKKIASAPRDPSEFDRANS